MSIYTCTLLLWNYESIVKLNLNSQGETRIIFIMKLEGEHIYE